MVEDILGYEVTNSPVDVLLEQIGRHISSGASFDWLACLNPHSYVVAKSDESFRTSLRSARWLVPDGIGVVLASKILRGRVTRRITGADIFSGVNSYLNSVGGTVFFLGASDDTLNLIRKKMAIDYPNVDVVGVFSPPFKSSYSEVELAEMVRRVNDAKPDVLWVGMTAPKQEKWIFNNIELLDVKFAGAIGAVFDFYAGKVKRSPYLFQKLGLEWLPRFLQQPRRLWRRVFISAPLFIIDVFRQVVR